MNKGSELVKSWHDVIRSRDASRIGSLLADDIVFHSPVVHTPQTGKKITSLYLTAAYHVLLNDSFRYVREIIGERDLVLEFEVEIDGILVNGVDIISWNDEGKISDFKVMIRPLKGVNIVHQKMAEMLERFGAAKPL
jgi:hypothetical protein